MRILIDSYNECFQNSSGGVRIKIESFTKRMSQYNSVTLFNKWTDKISDFDILHVFKPGLQNYREILFAVAEKESMKAIYVKKAICKAKLHIPYYYYKEIYDLADCIITETIYEKEFIMQAYNINAKKISILPNGIDLNYTKNYRQLFFDKTGLADPFLLQVGRFDANKNQLNTIRALNETNYKAVFIGGPDKDDLDYYKKCKNEANDNIIFLGWVNHDDPILTGAYQSCYSFILPSYKEILGNALLEAGACGANLISTNVLPLDNWGIADLTLQINPSDIMDIKNKIEKSMNTPKNYALQRIITDQFDWNKIIDEHSNIYRRILSDKTHKKNNSYT